MSEANDPVKSSGEIYNIFFTDTHTDDILPSTSYKSTDTPRPVALLIKNLRDIYPEDVARISELLNKIAKDNQNVRDEHLKEYAKASSEIIISREYLRAVQRRHKELGL